MATSKYLSIITVMRDGSHLLYQAADLIPGYSGIAVGAHIALRRKQHGHSMASVIIIDGTSCTVHEVET